MEENIMAQFVLDRVLSVAGADAVDGKVLFLADQIVDPSLSFTSETEDIVDATNNVVMVLENGRGATFSASNSFFNTQILAAQVGGKVESGATTIEKYEIVTPVEGKITLGSAIALSEGKFTGKVYELTNDGSLTAADAIAATYVAATEGTPAQGTEGEEGYVPAVSAVPEHLTVTTTAKKVLVKYTTSIDADEKISAFADAKNKLMNITAEVLLKELCNEELYYAYIVMKGKLSGETEWAMTRDGQHGFEIRCFPEYCGDKKLVDIIIVKGE
jgi:hypothetical protein